MDARFRVRTRDEMELRPATVDDFAALVASGDITPDDLVYDGLTGEWAPAWAHPIYQLVTDPLVAGADTADTAATDAAAPADAADPTGAGGPEASDGSEASEASDGGSDEPEPALSLELVEIQEPSPEEDRQAFLARMEEERARDPDAPPLAFELPLVDGRPPVEAATFAEVEEPDADAAAARASPVAPPRAGPPPGADAGADSGGDRPPRAPATAPPPRRPFWRSWGAAAVFVAVALGLTAVVARTQFRFGDTLPVRAEAASSDRPVRAVDASEESVRSAAWAGLVDRVDAARRETGVVAVPDGWLEGTYLANASDFPQMRVFWSDYLRFVERVHAGDADLYRDAYLEVLDERQVTGPVRSLRVAAALSDFEAGAARRDDLYARAWELSTASLDLHEALLDLETAITYEPARGGAVSADPVLEAAGQDPETQAALEAALDRVLVALHGGGADARSSWAEVPLWLTRGLEELGPAR